MSMSNTNWFGVNMSGFFIDSRVALIQVIIARCWGLKSADLRGPSRAQNHCHARWIAILLCRELGMTLVDIGNSFGGRDHKTIDHGLKKAQEMIDQEPELANLVASVGTAVKSQNLSWMAKFHGAAALIPSINPGAN